MQFTFRATKDTITPDLKKRLAALGPANRAWILRGMAESLVQMTKSAFYSPALRPTPWAAKADGSVATLRRDQVLRRSPRVVAVDSKRAIIGSDRRYAAIHQLGGKTPAHVIKPRNKKALFWPGAGHPVGAVKHPGSKIPARPFFPFYASGAATPQAKARLDAVARKRLGLAK